MSRIILIAVAFLAACSGSSDVLTPRETADAMLALAEAGNWGEYVDQFYGEQDKFAAPADRDALVARFQDEWGERMLVALRGLEGIEPVVEDDRALFRRNDIDLFVLYRDARGRWGFHL